jgi:hypothetical protein
LKKQLNTQIKNKKKKFFGFFYYKIILSPKKKNLYSPPRIRRRTSRGTGLFAEAFANGGDFPSGAGGGMDFRVKAP